MGKSLGSFKGFCRLRSIYLNPAVGVMRMTGGVNENWFAITGPFLFFPPVKGMRTASNDAMGQPEDSHI